MLFAIAFLSETRAVGTYDSGQDVISDGNYSAHHVAFYSNKSIRVSFTANVVKGPNIDVFFMDSANYQKYQANKSFTYYQNASQLNTTNASISIVLKTHDTYYIVFDNTPAGTPTSIESGDVAYVNYTIIVSVLDYNSAPLEDNFFLLFICGYCLWLIAIIIFQLVVGIWIYRDAEKRGMNGVLWLIVIALLGIIGLIVYLVVRKNHHRSTSSAPPPPYYLPQPHPQYGTTLLPCPYCYAMNPPASNYCSKCGARLR